MNISTSVSFFLKKRKIAMGSNFKVRFCKLVFHICFFFRDMAKSRIIMFCWFFNSKWSLYHIDTLIPFFVLMHLSLSLSTLHRLITSSSPKFFLSDTLYFGFLVFSFFVYGHTCLELQQLQFSSKFFLCDNLHFFFFFGYMVILVYNSKIAILNKISI